MRPPGTTNPTCDSCSPTCSSDKLDRISSRQMNALGAARISTQSPAHKNCRVRLPSLPRPSGMRHASCPRPPTRICFPSADQHKHEAWKPTRWRGPASTAQERPQGECSLQASGWTTYNATSLSSNTQIAELPTLLLTASGDPSGHVPNGSNHSGTSAFNQANARAEAMSLATGHRQRSPPPTCTSRWNAAATAPPEKSQQSPLRMRRGGFAGIEVPGEDSAARVTPPPVWQTPGVREPRAGEHTRRAPSQKRGKGLARAAPSGSGVTAFPECRKAGSWQHSCRRQGLPLHQRADSCGPCQSSNPTIDRNLQLEGHLAAAHPVPRADSASWLYQRTGRAALREPTTAAGGTAVWSSHAARSASRAMSGRHPHREFGRYCTNDCSGAEVRRAPLRCERETRSNGGTW